MKGNFTSQPREDSRRVPIEKENLSEQHAIPYFYHDGRSHINMSENPEERNKDSRKASENSIEQPLDKADPTEPVQVGGAKEGKGTSTTTF
jgi:hypothetical protein